MNVRLLIIDDDVRISEIHRRYVEKIEGFEVSRKSGIDIDDYFDFEVARFFLKKN